MPAEVIDERHALRQVLLDRGQLVVTAAVARQRLLQGAVFQKLLPVDLLDPLFLAAFVQVGYVELLRRHGRGIRGRGLDRGKLAVLAVGVGTGPGVDFLVGEDGVGIEFLANLVDELEPRQLQEPDRLLQLGRHHQLLTEFELLFYLHPRLT